MATLRISDNTPVAAAAITNRPVGEVVDTVAAIHGQVTDTGGEVPTVTVHWGDDNPGVGGAWDHTTVLTNRAGAFSTILSNLAPGTTYHYHLSAQNSAGVVWAPSATSFITPYLFEAWATGPFSQSLTDNDMTLDFDKGGLPTGLEWALVGDPTDASDDISIAPMIDVTSDPNGRFLFVHRRSDDAHEDSGTTIEVEYGSDLTGWTIASHQGWGADDISITEDNDFYDSGIDRVTVALPPHLADHGTLFARLAVTVSGP